MHNNSHNVNVHITFKNTSGSDALKTYAADKLKACIQKFTHHDTEAHVVLKVEKHRQIAEVSLHSDGNDIFAKEESADLYASVDALIGSLTQQLRKHKEKLTKHH